MPYFREEFEDDTATQYETAEDLLGTALWYHWCGWELSAKKLLDELARRIPDYEEYEETRFE